MTAFAELTGNKVYLAGPMRGYPEHNAPAFREAAQWLRLQGTEVISPVELDESEGLDLNDSYSDEEVGDFLRRDLISFLTGEVDAIVVLPGWEESQGAALEVHVARETGLPIYSYPDGELVKAPTKYRPPTDETIAETAQRLVGGDRQQDYGHPIDDFQRTAGVINALFATEFEARDIPLLMIAVKLSRIIQSPEKRDSLVDLVGYALTREMVAEREGRPLR